MARRRKSARGKGGRVRPKLCQDCKARAPRRRQGARLCSPCVAKYPKATCKDCGGEFAPDLMHNGVRCRPCQSDRLHDQRTQQTYGLGPGQYKELLEFQGGVSAITGATPKTKRLAVDHDHETGEVRGLLTKHENFYVIGWLERHDDPFAILDALRDYLTEPPARRLWGDDVPRQDVM